MQERTSRVGRKPITIPSGVEINVKDRVMSVKGPKGKSSISLHAFVNVSTDNGVIQISPNAEEKKFITGSGKKLYRSIAGTVRANINNSIIGVTQGFEVKLLMVGVGYRAQSKGKVLSLSLGFSHPTEFDVPEGITVETPIPTEILVKGVSKEQVGLAAAQIREYRSVEPYKGKGVRYADEVVELKETKKK